MADDFVDSQHGGTVEREHRILGKKAKNVY